MSPLNWGSNGIQRTSTSVPEVYKRPRVSTSAATPSSDETAEKPSYESLDNEPIPVSNFNRFVARWDQADVDNRETEPLSARHEARARWLEYAREQLNGLDAEAEEEGIEPPSAEARAFAEKFVEEFSGQDLPSPSVFPDDDCGVSIQMEVTGFIFLLTCLEDGSGIYNAIHDTYRVSGSYRDLSIARIAESEFLRHMRCLMRPLSNHASLADRTK